MEKILKKYGNIYSKLRRNPAYSSPNHLPCLFFILLYRVLFSALAVLKSSFYAAFLKAITRFTSSPWASEGFFPRGALGDFFLLFPGGAKSSEIWFFPLKTEKTTFFAENFKIQGDQGPPWPPPSDARAPHSNTTCFLDTFFFPQTSSHTCRIESLNFHGSCASSLTEFLVLSTYTLVLRTQEYVYYVIHILRQNVKSSHFSLFS